LKGEAFDKVAAEVSDAPSNANGGLIGPIPKTELSAEMVNIIGAMKVGEITQVIPMGGGYEIFKLESTIASTTLPFEQARSQIADKIGSERQEKALQAYIKKLRAQAIIDWKNPEIHKAWEAGVAAQDKQQGN
jgi:parvulin-like peptidyl-prolyl isomerase